MSKPKNCTYPDCFSCLYKDCRYSGGEEDVDAYIHTESPNARKITPSQVRYEESEKGKETRKRYRTTTGYRESQKKYRETERAKELNRKRVSEYSRRKSNEIGKPLATARQHLQKYGVNMGKGEAIGTLSTCGRLNIPKRFLESLGLNDGSKVAIYVQGGKLVVISLKKHRKSQRKPVENVYDCQE